MAKETKFDRLPFYLLIFSGLVYVFFVLSAAYYNRLVADDYCFKADVLKYGFFNSFQVYYTTWQGRFGAHIITNAAIFFYDSSPSLFIYAVLLVGLYLFAIYRILRLLLLFQLAGRPLILWAMSILIFNTFLLTVYDLSAFYWLGASAVYFSSIAFALLGISELLSPSKSIFSYIMLIISFTIAGSSAENFGLILNLLLLLFLTYQTFYEKINGYSYQKTVIAFAFCFTAFLFMIFAPGTQVRKSLYPEVNIFYAAYRSFKYVYYTILALVAQRAIFLLVLSVAMIYVGTLCRNEKAIDERWVVKVLAAIIPLFLCFLAACVFPNVYAMGGIGEYRSLAHIAFYIVVFIATISFLIGYKTYFPMNLSRLFAIIGSITFLIMANDMRIRLHYTKQYVASEDARIAYLYELKKANTKGTITLKPLYYTPYNIFVPNEIQTQGGYPNSCISNAMNLGFNIRIE
jgi:hypothetical protein